jgi:hypothetical protein
MSDVLATSAHHGQLIGAIVNLGGTGRYVHWGFIQISWSNLVIIGIMFVMFLLAILLPFPGHREGQK